MRALPPGAFHAYVKLWLIVSAMLMTNSSIWIERCSEPEAAVSGVTTQPRFLSKIRENISTWVLWWRLWMGASQTPKPVQEDECLPRVSVIELREAQPERKLERRRIASGPRRRGLDNELEGERRRPIRKPKKR